MEEILFIIHLVVVVFAWYVLFKAKYINFNTKLFWAALILFIPFLGSIIFLGYNFNRSKGNIAN